MWLPRATGGDTDVSQRNTETQIYTNRGDGHSAASSAEAAAAAALASATTAGTVGAAATTGALATAGGGAIAAGGAGMAGGVGTIAATAATSAAVPIIGWAVGIALLGGLGAWGVYKLATSDK